MAGALWTFDPPYPEDYPARSPKVIVAGAEPNDEGAEKLPRRDMGVAIRMQLTGGKYQRYQRATLRQVRAVLPADMKDQPDEEVLKHLRYIDLKATGGRGRANKKEVAAWVQAPEHLHQVVGYWLNDRPEYTVLQGGITQEVFKETVAPLLVEGLKVGLPHPSLQNEGSFNDPAYDEALKQVHQQLRRFDEPLRYWAPRKKEWRTR